MVNEFLATVVGAIVAGVIGVDSIGAAVFCKTRPTQRRDSWSRVQPRAAVASPDREAMLA